jgi:hypothetical protein
MTPSNKLARCGLRKNRREILRFEDSAQNDGLFTLGNKIQWVSSFVAQGAPQDGSGWRWRKKAAASRLEAGATKLRPNVEELKKSQTLRMTSVFVLRLAVAVPARCRRYKRLDTLKGRQSHKLSR